jgi:fructose-1,6-bisphosphatase I
MVDMPARADVETKIPLSVALGRWSGGQPARKALADVLVHLAEAAARLSLLVAANPLRGPGSEARTPAANASGDEQKPLDIEAEALFIAAVHGCDVAAVCSEESPDPVVVRPGGSLLVTLDPVDGSSNIETLAPIGTIFSVLPVGEGGTAAAALRPGRDQLAAGLVVYGPSTMLVLTVGDGTDLYALDPASGSFVRTRGSVELPAEAGEYAINASNARHWGPGISEYIDDLVSGSRGPREREFNMRWLASLVGEAYRIFIRGGVFLYPADSRPGYENGRIRLVYEANPVALLCEQAGGAATDGTRPVLDLVPTDLHQRVPFVFGSRDKVGRVARYLQAPQPVQARSPLFSERGLLRRRGGA